jgi:hypothetical protein
MEPGYLLLSAEEATFPCPESDEPSLHTHTVFKIHFDL